MSSSKLGNDPRRYALQLARRYLRFGVRSTAEVRAYLAARGFAESVIRHVVEDCTQAGWLDDAVAVRLLAAQFAERGYADQAISQRLRQKGFHARVVAQTIRTRPDDADDCQRASALVRRWQRSQRSLEPRRVARRLAQRGFDPDVIDRVLADHRLLLSTDD